MRRILGIRFSALGDVVLSTCLLELLRRREPGAQLWWLTKRAYAPLLAADPRIDHLVVLEPGESLPALVRRLAPVGFDAVYDAHASLRSRALTPWLGAPVTRLQKDGWARWIHLHGGPVLAPLQRRLVDRYASMVEPGTPPPRPRVHPGTQAEEHVDRRWRTRGPVLALAPGAKHQTKRWPAERFVALGRAARERLGAEIRVFGGPNEREIIEAIAEELAVPVWPPDGPLDQLAAALARVRLLVGNDSGLLHLAEAVGTPVVGLYGPTVRAWGYFPLDPRSVAVEVDLPCRPCSKMGENPCRLADRICLTRIDVATVLARVEERWTRDLVARP